MGLFVVSDYVDVGEVVDEWGVGEFCCLVEEVWFGGE